MKQNLQMYANQLLRHNKILNILLTIYNIDRQSLASVELVVKNLRQLFEIIVVISFKILF